MKTNKQTHYNNLTKSMNLWKVQSKNSIEKEENITDTTEMESEY